MNYLILLATMGNKPGHAHLPPQHSAPLRRLGGALTALLALTGACETVLELGGNEPSQGDSAPDSEQDAGLKLRVLFSGSPVRAIALHGDRCYVVRPDGALSVRTNGDDAPVASYSLPVATDDQRTPMAGAVDDESVYLAMYSAEGTGAIAYAPRIEAGSAAAKDLCLGIGGEAWDPSPFDRVCAVLADSKSLFFMTNQGLMRAPKRPSGGGTGLVGYEQLSWTLGCSTKSPEPWSIADDDARIYWSNGITIRGNSKDNGAVSMVSTPTEAPVSMVVFEERLYWTQTGDGKNDGSICSAATTGSDPEDLATSLARPYGIAASGGFLYWTESGSCYPAGGSVWKSYLADGSVWRKRLGGGDAELLAEKVPCPRGIAVDSTHVVWVQEQPSVPGADEVVSMQK